MTSSEVNELDGTIAHSRWFKRATGNPLILTEVFYKHLAALCRKHGREMPTDCLVTQQPIPMYGGIAMTRDERLKKVEEILQDVVRYDDDGCGHRDYHDDPCSAAQEIDELYVPPGEKVVTCPKCGAVSGDSWSQCGGQCPMPASPHYVPPPWGADAQAAETVVVPKALLAEVLEQATANSTWASDREKIGQLRRAAGIEAP